MIVMHALKKMSSVVVLFIALSSSAQYVTKPDNLTAIGIPPLPTSILKEVKPYTEARAAAMVAWHPVREEILMATRLTRLSSARMKILVKATLGNLVWVLKIVFMIKSPVKMV